MDPLGRKIADYYPAPNRTAVGVGNFLATDKLRTNFYIATARADYRVSERQNVFARISWQSTHREEPSFDYGVELPGFGLVYETDGRNVALSDTYVFGPRVVNEARVEFVRLTYDVDTTVKKVAAIEELDNFLGTRLLDGR